LNYPSLKTKCMANIGYEPAGSGIPTDKKGERKKEKE
jgi:hypothetical protein